MANIGISTSSYLDNGNITVNEKLTVDETKLRAALTANPDRVIAMFTQQSTTAYSPDNTSAQSTTRYNENGTLYRLDDILSDYVRTTRNAAGQKGILLEKAGIINDMSDFNNSIQFLINDKDTAINDLTDKLKIKEDAYYRQFSAMETALNRMNSQSSWISQQFGGGSK
jgi:flagellar hook-associated protein 2